MQTSFNIKAYIREYVKYREKSPGLNTQPLPLISPLLDTHIHCMPEHNCLLSKEDKSFKNVLKEESYKEQRKTICMLLFKMHIVVLK